MLKQAQLVGVLYLENRLSPQAFTAEHAKVLVLLAAQAAVSLETARLYAELLAENQQRRSIEKALRESKATLLQGEQINRSGSWTWEVGRGVLTCSAEFCRIFGFDPAQPLIEFTACVARIHPDDRNRVTLHTTGCVALKIPIRVEYRIVGDDGAVRYICGVGEPMGGDGEADTDMYVGTAIDITERRAAEDYAAQRPGRAGAGCARDHGGPADGVDRARDQPAADVDLVERRRQPALAGARPAAARRRCAAACRTSPPRASAPAASSRACRRSRASRRRCLSRSTCTRRSATSCRFHAANWNATTSRWSCRCRPPAAG